MHYFKGSNKVIKIVYSVTSCLQCLLSLSYHLILHFTHGTHWHVYQNFCGEDIM